LQYNITDRLVKLRKAGHKYYAVDVICELRKRGIKVNSADFSRFVNGIEDPPRSELILSEADKIVAEWESKVN
jgi:uncharacterized protein (DUF1778 family)